MEYMIYYIMVNTVYNQVNMFWVCPKVGDPQIYSIMGKMMISHWIRQSHLNGLPHIWMGRGQDWRARDHP